MQDGVIKEGSIEEPIECCGCCIWELIENLCDNATKYNWNVF